MDAGAWGCGAPAAVSRQAITKHLRVLEGAGSATRRRLGRESVFELRPEALREAERYLRVVSAQWRGALMPLKAMVGGKVGVARGGAFIRALLLGAWG